MIQMPKSFTRYKFTNLLVFLYIKIIKPKLQSFAAILLRIYDAKSLNVIALEENVVAFVKVEGILVYPFFFMFILLMNKTS